jgi:hypothetical protein
VKTKWNLTKSEQRTHSENAERLKSGGVALGVEKTASSEPPRLRVEQSEYSFIYAGDRKGFALAVCVELMALKSGITICDYEITISRVRWYKDFVGAGSRGFSHLQGVRVA